MKYRITRTSDWYCREKPYSKAYQDGFDKYDHRIWFVEIKSLEDLHNIIQESDSKVIVFDDCIEIYDDFRE